jgi:uncharacterized protein YndB with AHSA1/START domain
MSEKVRVDLEYMIHASDHILYNCISNPSGLEEWFADEVNIRGDVYTFIWEGEERKAELVSTKKDQFVKFHWMDDGKEKTFFELRIKIDEMTGEVALLVTDFCDAGDEDDCKMLWDSSIENLRRIVGG